MNSIAGRLMLILLAIHAVLVPALYLAITRVVDGQVIAAFIDDARAYGRIVVDGLENLGPTSGRAELVRYLDGAILGGHTVYAAILDEDNQRVSSALTSGEDVGAFQEDFGFDMHGDDIYYLSMAFASSTGTKVLQLGFDETAVTEDIASVRRTMIWILGAYVVLTLTAAALLSTTIVRPIRWLQRTGRRVALGEFDERLVTDSSIVEIKELAENLEQMRMGLVGANSRLRQEIVDREKAQAEQRSLERRLHDAQRLESLGTLAGGVAHEFNNVLQPMLMYAELAMDELPSESESANFVDQIYRLGTRARGLSRQILTFSRKASDVDFSTQSLQPVIEEATTMFRALTPATTVLRVRVDAGVGAVRCEAGQINQAVVNLCNNASSAVRKSGGWIEVRLREVEFEAGESPPVDLPPGTYAVIEVEDNGTGMSREIASRIFEPFYTNKPVGSGTGLGLSVVHGIVQAHGGDIAFRTSPGKGSLFQIFLPVVAAASTHSSRSHDHGQHPAG